MEFVGYNLIRIEDSELFFVMDYNAQTNIYEIRRSKSYLYMDEPHIFIGSEEIKKIFLTHREFDQKKRDEKYQKNKEDRLKKEELAKQDKEKIETNFVEKLTIKQIIKILWKTIKCK